MRDETDSAALLAAVTAAYTIGVLGGNLQPLLIGALIDSLHMDASRAGLLGSIELAAVATASFIVAPRIGRVPRRSLILLGAAAAAAAYGASALPQSFAAFIPLRVLAGAGAGVVLAVGNATVSACRHPDRVFARMTLAGTVLITIVLALLPLLITRFAYRGGYIGMAVLCLLLLPLFAWIPDLPPAAEVHGDAPMSQAVLGAATLLSAALLFFNQSGVWAFSERLAVLAHLDHEQIGFALSFSTFAGLLGAGLAARVGTQAGRTLPLLVGVLTTGLTLVALVHVNTPRAYVAILTLNGIAYLFMVPYVFGTAAALDRQGRWAAATIGAATIGAALGPGIVGPVVQTYGYAGLGSIVLAFTCISAAAVAPVARALDRAERTAV